MPVSQTIKLADIIVADRLRAVDEDRALFLAANMKAEGLNVPLEVRPHPKKAGKYLLVSGGHRHRGAVILEWEDIEAVVLSLSPDQARLREIDENLYRTELTELDRAVFLAEKKRLYEKLNPSTKHGGDRRSDQAAIFGDMVPRFSQEACEKLDLSERSLQRLLKRATLPADVRARLAGTPMANKGADLDALVKLPPEQRMPVLDLMFGKADDAPRSVGEASQRLAGARPAVVSKEDAQYDALLKVWKAAGTAARNRFADFIAEHGGNEAEAA
ncbi:ParB N-terminal domain-containing protein [Ancylobacter defluvii]|uniref:ParB-like N-terminal domain-containing protein n=1 Tax=Ancylobacter defluvii TaxID=1282440 RepID=A0A9W6JXK6_9HYPH|nr:ParB N-terminal domain-containing protein [Ancylobacter defluvii]MBS7586445.1 ParB N-terminal domain-containing protein [Ancylobacter defluvii]GLK85726.1 hypothetical protein GCM10017653_37960 [Ancylobacter defluvii]